MKLSDLDRPQFSYRPGVRALAALTGLAICLAAWTVHESHTLIMTNARVTLTLDSLRIEYETLERFRAESVAALRAGRRGAYLMMLEAADSLLQRGEK